MGEVFDACNGHCQRSCSVPNPKCTLQCVPGCVCPSGQVRNEDGKCVELSSCQVTTPTPSDVCPTNESYTACGAKCQATCAIPEPMICPTICAPGCLCNKPYVRAADGTCVLKEDCPPKCGQNEYWGPCGHNSCENCLVFLQQAFCRPFCQPGCQCLEGHYRNDEGVCIPEEQCQLTSTTALVDTGWC
jgi:Trypsin Inhibitor like cysteine rich domain